MGSVFQTKVLRISQFAGCALLAAGCGGNDPLPVTPATTTSDFYFQSVPFREEKAAVNCQPFFSSFVEVGNKAVSEVFQKAGHRVQSFECRALPQTVRKTGNAACQAQYRMSFVVPADEKAREIELAKIQATMDNLTPFPRYVEFKIRDLTYPFVSWGYYNGGLPAGEFIDSDGELILPYILGRPVSVPPTFSLGYVACGTA
jgi:hypothetical protein